MAETGKADELEEALSTSQVLRILERAPQQADADDHARDSGAVPTITKLPPGIEVVERRLGRAVAQWVLQVRCDCGRRWFEVEAVETSNCPQCGALVLLEIEPR